MLNTKNYMIFFNENYFGSFPFHTQFITYDSLMMFPYGKIGKNVYRCRRRRSLPPPLIHLSLVSGSLAVCNGGKCILFESSD